MALLAHIHLPFPRHFCRIDQSLVVAGGPVAALAIDAVGDGIVPPRIGIVAEEAVLADWSPEVLMIRPVIAWTHSPGPALLAVPTHGQLDQRAVVAAMKE